MPIEKISKKSWIERDVLPKNIEFSKFHFGVIMNMKPKTTTKFKMFGRECEMKRLQKVYGKDYIFSGTIHKSDPIPEFFYDIIKYFNLKYKRNYNMLLINWYRTGEDNISMHSDNEPQIKKDSEIVTISLGAERDFILQNIKSKKKYTYSMRDNEYITMGGKCQKEYKHGIPVRKGVKNYRISITLREFI